MATQVTPDLEVSAPEGSFEVVELTGGGTEITNTKIQKDVTFKIEGDSLVDGKSMKDSKIVAKTESGETSKISVNTKTFKNGIITAKGSGSTNLKIGGDFNGSKIILGNEADSINFKGGKVKNGQLKLGEGADTIKFGARTKFSGKTKVDLGNGSADVVEFKSAPKGGKVVINKFDEQDTLKVGGVEYSYDDIKNGNTPDFPNIKINLD